MIKPESIPAHDVLTGGFPCQPFSFSGRREGFGDPRGTLFLEIVKIAAMHQPKALLLGEKGDRSCDATPCDAMPCDAMPCAKRRTPILSLAPPLVPT